AGIDALKARKKAGYDHPELRAQLDTESVAEYCDRRLNAEIRDALIAPVMGGLYVNDGAKLSVADLHFTLTKILAGGMLGYRGGIDFFARALADRLDVRTSCRVTHVERDAASARVTWANGDGEQTETVDGAILTVAAPFVAPMYPGLDPGIQSRLLEGFVQANFISVRLALKRRPDEDAMLIVVPSDELGGIATVMFEHHIAQGCAPEGKGLVGVLLYHEWVTPRLALTDEQLLDELLPDLDHLVPGIAEMIEFFEITRWTPGALRSVPGTHKLMAEIVERMDPADRVQLAGDYLSIPSINGSVVSGEAAAQRLAGALGG
ncbi:MAG TPA: FAD-dependent oxidoreductase, partial [Solirubrobacteraceae bacterium]